MIDNDPAAGAQQTVAELSPSVPLDAAAQLDPSSERHSAIQLRYVHEPLPGIAAARNRALDEAAGAAALVFIDDDEQPAAGWLLGLVECWRANERASVSGPVEPEFDGAAPSAWIRACGRFDRRRRPTGTMVRGGATNNLLLDLPTVERLRLRFDESFGLTGGEDTAFTQALVAGGGRILWCDEAVVHDHIPADRLTRSWVLRREFRSGNSWTHMRLARTPNPARRVLLRADLALRGCLRMVLALSRWAWGLAARDVRHQARGACRFFANAGLVAGTFGHRYTEYRRSS